MSTNPASKSKAPANQASNAPSSEEPYQDEPVPSYETAVRQGASGSTAAGPSSSSSAAPHPNAHCHPAYGCSPYTPQGTARIVIVPAPQFHAQQHYSHMHHPQHYSHMHSAQGPSQPLLPVPVSMQSTPAQRAQRRFVIALLQAIFIYMFINVLVGFTMSSRW